MEIKEPERGLPAEKSGTFNERLRRCPRKETDPFAMTRLMVDARRQKLFRGRLRRMYYNIRFRRGGERGGEGGGGGERRCR